MLAVLWFDVTRYLIPNWLVGSLLVLYPVALYVGHAHVDWKMALLGMALVFAVGYFVFAMKWMGGGDIKLLTACALWVGWQGLPEFIAFVALLGGVFAVVVWGLRKALIHMPVKVSFRLLQDGAPIPYGVAIAIGFLITMAEGQIPALL